MIAKTIGIAAVASLALVPVYAQDAAPADQDQQPPSVAGQPQEEAQQPDQSQQDQAAQDQAQAAPETVVSAAVTDAEVDQFARAYVEIRKVQDEVQAGGDAAADQAESTERMNGILEDHDLSVERYNQIARSLASDQTLMQRIQAKMAEIQAETSAVPTPSASPDAPSAPGAPDDQAPE